jgi:hypothetical protein
MKISGGGDGVGGGGGGVGGGGVFPRDAIRRSAAFTFKLKCINDKTLKCLQSLYLRCALEDSSSCSGAAAAVVALAAAVSSPETPFAVVPPSPSN